ncbi:MAG: tyrosine-type recombinase/integrase [Bacteroidetes bacterium]|nr:tyrosine-type recombinase/integrase [Bacteroidota bacterium]
MRDLFVIGCWTGLRFSDFTKLRKDNIAKGIISIRTQKTDQALMIPIHPMVMEIFKKYTVSDEIILPRAITNQNMNDYLKVIGQKQNWIKRLLSHQSRHSSGQKSIPT